MEGWHTRAAPERGAYGLCLRGPITRMSMHLHGVLLTSLWLATIASSAAGCAATGAVPSPFPRPGGWPAPRSAPVPDRTPSSADGYAIAGTALSLRGAPYRNGGSDPSGFDCSGLVQYVFSQHGLGVPRTVADQYRVGRQVSPDQVQPGDLVFFNTAGAGASHVGISIGGDEFVHAPSERGEVRVERLSASYWADRIVGARRVLSP
jgi:peptidoglycan endopeptidase LytE